MMTTNTPIIILSCPSLSQNIGATARAMLNFGLTHLRLISPRASWLTLDARRMSANAHSILESAQVYETAEAAFADLNVIYATTARPRDMVKEVLSPREAAPEIATHLDQGNRVGIVFGSEKCGLDNETLTLAHKIITIPLNPAFRSLNLAQAVIILAYELFQNAPPMPFSDPLWEKDPLFSSRGELLDFFHHLEEELEKKGYFRTTHKRPLMQRNLRNIFARLPLTAQEVRTLRGVITTLVSPFVRTNRSDKQKKQIDKPL